MMHRRMRLRRWKVMACATIFALALLSAACAESGGHLEGDLHDQLHEIAHLACARVEGGAAAGDVVAETVAEAVALGATEAQMRDILEEECSDLLE